MELRISANMETMEGKALMQDGIFNAEQLEMDKLCDALDCFNRATKYASDVDPEIAAITEYNTGYLFHKALKNKKKAKQHFTVCLYYVEALKPKVVTEEAWYQKACLYLQEVRDALLKEEQNAINNETKEYVEALKDEFAELTEAKGKGDRSYLEKLNDKFLPKETAKFEFEEASFHLSKMKKLIIKFVAVFHPDKQSGMDAKTKFFREEICKTLNVMNERYKECSQAPEQPAQPAQPASTESSSQPSPKN